MRFAVQAVAPHGNQRGDKEGEMDYETVTTKKRVNGRDIPWRKFRKELLPDDVFEVSLSP
jgi:hypothetical protein